MIDQADSRTADVAWVIGVRQHGQGFASEAGHSLISWLIEIDVDEVVAHINSDQRMSALVAVRAGLVPTD